MVWSLSRHLPVDEARRFVTAPIHVGDEPRPGPPTAIEPASVAEAYARAEGAFGEGRWRDAARDFEWVVTHDPGGAQAGPAQWNLTRSRLRSGDGNGALDALDGLIRHYGTYLGQQAPAVRAGLEHLERDEHAAARAAFERMIREQPDSEFVPLAHALIGRVRWADGEPMEAVRAFARMFSSVKDPVPGYGQLARNLERYAGGERGMSEEFGRMARGGPEGFRDIYQYLAARSLLEQNKFNSARDALEELRRKHPGGDFTHIVDLEEAWNLLRNQRPAEALAIFQRLEATPAPAEAKAFDEFFDLRSELPMGIARCQLALGHYAEAVAAFERALREYPKGIYAVEDQVGIAMAYDHLGQLDRAAEVLRTVIAEHPDEPNLWALRQQLGRIEERLAAEHEPTG